MSLVFFVLLRILFKNPTCSRCTFNEKAPPWHTEVSFVNSICTSRGGTHVNHVCEQVGNGMMVGYLWQGTSLVGYDSWLLLKRPRLFAALCVVGICRISWWVFCKHYIAYIYTLLKTGDFWGSPWTEGLGLTRLVILKRSVYSRYLWNILEYFSVTLHLWTLFTPTTFSEILKMDGGHHREALETTWDFIASCLPNKMWRFQIDWGATRVITTIEPACKYPHHPLAKRGGVSRHGGAGTKSR